MAPWQPMSEDDMASGERSAMRVKIVDQAHEIARLHAWVRHYNDGADAPEGWPNETAPHMRHG